MKVWLDDEREPPEGWVGVRWPEDAIELLVEKQVDVISLDHDLGDDDRGTGYDVVEWIEEAVVKRGFEPPEIRIHSANISARQRMEDAIRSIRRLSRLQKENDGTS
jgi:hypothetical protein